MADQPGNPGGPQSQGEHRPVSVTFSSGSERQTTGAMFDPANQSLADALRITFRLLQIGMVVLVALFFLSGFQSIKEGEAGVRLLFGRVAGDDLPPGFRFSWPYPFGELIKVNKGTVTLSLDEEFWPKLDDQRKRLSIQELAGQAQRSLKPGLDGSLITADGNLAHTQWKVEYRRVRPSDFVQNILAEDEARIVRGAVRRGVVHAVAQTPIDDLLKQSSADDGSVATRARLAAQELLDALDSGIEIERLSMEQKVPPFRVYGDFAAVEAAQSSAAERIQKAQSQASQLLTAAAGGAHEALAEQIALYESAIETGDQARQAEIVGRIHALLEGRPVEIDGVVLEGLASGRVASILSEAEQHRAGIYARGQAELAVFRSKLEQFRTNPSVTLTTDWAGGLQQFLSRDTVQAFWLAPGPQTAEIWLNEDADIVRDLERAERERRNRAAAEQRTRRQDEMKFQVNTETRSYQAD